MAALYGHVHLCTLLIEAGADPTVRDGKGRTARDILWLVLRAAERDFSVAVSRMATIA